MTFINEFIRDVVALIKTKSIEKSLAEIKKCAFSDTASVTPYG